jgi:hypothetical protein
VTSAGATLISESGGLPIGLQRAAQKHANLQRQLGLTLARTTRANHEAISALSGFGTIPMNPAFKSALSGFGTIPMNPAFKSALSGLQLLTKARVDVFSSMSMQLSALARPPDWWSSLIADNLAMTSRVAADVAAITDSLALPSRLERSSAHRIQLGVGQVVAAHNRLLESSLAGLLNSPAGPRAAGIIVTPTTTTAAFTSLARGIVMPAPMVRDTTDLLADSVEELAHRLEDVGAHAAARDLGAALDVLRRRHPGWPKSGAHLLREVLREALDELAPPALVPRDANGDLTKRAQVTWMVGGDKTLAIWIDVTSGNVGRLHSLLSAEAKNSGSPRVGHQGLLGLLEVVMGLIRTMVEQIANRRPD